MLRALFEIKLLPLSAPRPRERLVFAPPTEALGLRDGDGDRTLVCGGDGCSFVFGRRVNPDRMAQFAFRCPACGIESEIPPPEPRDFARSA